MSRITKELKSETERNIIEAATALFQTQGFQKTTTKRIAENCGIAEGTLFNYFPSKDELLIAVFEHMAEHEEEDRMENMVEPIDRIIAIALDPVEKLSRIPRTFLIDILISSMKLIKKKPGLFHRLAKLDFDYIEKIGSELEHHGDFRDRMVTAKDLARMIYGVVAMDFLLQVYETDADYPLFKKRITPKLKELIEPYLIGGHKP